MTNDFKLHIKWYNPQKTEGIATLTDNGQPLLETECIEDARLLRDLLNELNNENKELKTQLENIYTMLDNAILLERTRMGKNCLKQFKEAIE
jgi:hypothetical protein